MLLGKYDLAENRRTWSRGRRRGGYGRPVLCFAVAATIILVGVGVTSRAASTVQSGYRVGQLKARLSALHSENESLEVEIARMQSLSRIEDVARNKLGMAPPGEIRVARTDSEWQAAMVSRNKEMEEALHSEREPSVFAFFTRLASGARTAQARPAR